MEGEHPRDDDDDSPRDGNCPWDGYHPWDGNCPWDFDHRIQANWNRQAFREMLRGGDTPIKLVSVVSRIPDNLQRK